jgi:hypothetical protein
MNTRSDRPEISIRTPCPKRWEELSGDDRRRYCSECSLHVLNAVALTWREARELVDSSEGRVCMRIEYDPAGAPVFRRSRAARLARWLAGAGAALLAACQGGSRSAPPAAPVEPQSRTGQVVAPEPLMGKVAAPVEMGGVAADPPLATLGEAVAVPSPPPKTPK